VQDQLLIFHILSQKPLEGGKTGVATWTDFKAAFDAMWHSALVTAMAAAGCSRKTTALVSEICKKTSAGPARSPINVARGCLQGCVLSPLPSCLVLGLVLEDAKTDPVVVDGLEVDHLAHADDVGATCSTAAGPSATAQGIADASRDGADGPARRRRLDGNDEGGAQGKAGEDDRRRRRRPRPRL